MKVGGKWGGGGQMLLALEFALLDSLLLLKRNKHI